MDKRSILALVLMSIVMLVWLVFLSPKSPQEDVDQGDNSPQIVDSPPETPDQETINIPDPADQTEDTLPAESEASTQSTRLDQLAESARLLIDTPLYTAEIIESTGTVAQWKLKRYDKRNGNSGEVVDLIPTLEDRPAVGSRCLELTSRTIRGLETANWVGERISDDVLNFTTQFGDLELTKRIQFSQDQYTADVTLIIANLSETPRSIDYALHWGPGITDDTSKPDKKYGPVVQFQDTLGKEKPIRDVEEEGASVDEAVWAGLQSKYFATVLIPETTSDALYRRRGSRSEDAVPYISGPLYEVMLENPKLVLGAQGAQDSQITHRYRLFAGPKESRLLRQVGFPDDDMGATDLHKLNDLGVFGLANVMLWMLSKLYSFVANYGIAILLLTTIIKLILFPLGQMSYRSTKKMQQIQPLMTEMRQKYRDDTQKMNKAMMRLYKEHGINPMGGCLPMLPQMPIFFALFYAVRDAAEMRSAQFLWIHDLSIPDTILRLGGLPINPLPILMGVSMFWQQSMAGTGATDANQAKIMKYLPLLFLFLFYNMPSGLVLYWFWNNVLTIAQQYLMNRKLNLEAPIVAEDSQKKPKRS